MHDWTLLSAKFEWAEARVTLYFLNSISERVSIIAEETTSLVMPKKDEWGRSVSVNIVTGPNLQEDGAFLLVVEMQCGDAIEVIARSFILPPA